MGILGWAIILLLVGIVILILEFFLPSSGLLGVLSTMAILGSIWLGFTHSMGAGATILTTVVILIPLILLGAVHYWPLTPIGRRMLIEPPDDEETLPNTELYRKLPLLVGKRGRARTEMLPGGSVEIDGRRYDAVSDSGAIDPGTAVVVTRLETQRLVVRIDDTPIVVTMVSPIDPAVPTREKDSPAAKTAPPEPADLDALTDSPFEEPLI